MNYFLTVACLLALVEFSKEDGIYDGLIYAPRHASLDYYSYPRYAYEYSVKDPHTGDHKTQWEKRDGDVVKGAYSLVEPDGSVRVVEYWADEKSGFNAVVKRIGPNIHPVAPPIYKAPIPLLNHDSIAPILVGSVAKIEALASAPKINGPFQGGAVSSTTLYKAAPIVKNIAPITTIEPIVHSMPVYKPPIIPEPIIKAAPVLSAPIYKSARLLPAINPKLLTPWSPNKDSLYLPVLSTLGEGLLKNSLGGHGYINDIRHDPVLRTWSEYLDYLYYGFKH